MATTAREQRKPSVRPGSGGRSTCRGVHAGSTADARGSELAAHRPRLVRAVRDADVAVVGAAVHRVVARAALEVADYAYVMERGRIAIEGTPAELRRDERVLAAYLG